MIASASFRSRAAAAALLLSFFLPTVRGQQADARAAPAFAGSETCQVCHEDVFNAFFKSNRHAPLEKENRRWEGRACESCHGPGSAHAESADAALIRNPAKLKPAEADTSCLSCHARQSTHVGRVFGGHARGQVACASCHPVHAPAPLPAPESRASRASRECAACHIGERAAFNRPHAHRLAQGAMSCTDCHNPHGAPGGMRLARSLTAGAGSEPGCFNCHGDKRGPFAFEHAPMRVEGCAACHEPHGSANPRMLTRATITVLCLECHSNIGLPGGGTVTGALGGIAPAFHDLRSARFRNCTTCHMKIHGSHVSKGLLR